MMKRTSITRTRPGRLSVVLVGLTLLGAAGCGDFEDKVETTQDAILGGWTNLPLLPGWQSYWAAPYLPAVGKVNGVVRLRGAIKASPGTTDNHAFTLPTNFQDGEALNLRTVLSGNARGMLTYEANIESPSVSVHEENFGEHDLGPNAKAFTSLEGISFDQIEGTPVPWGPGWHSFYPFREIGPNGVYVKNVDGFVRMQGLLAWNTDPADYDGFMLNLPSPYRPGQIVYVPANLGTAGGGKWGGLTIYPSGDVFVNGDPAAARAGVSFENVSYSLTNSGNIAFPYAPNSGWHAYSPRQVKVGKWTQDVVRFQGAIAGGNTTTLGTLPTGYRPAKTIRLVALASGPVPAYIVITTGGVMTVEGPPLNVAALLLSLDGVSFSL